MIYFLKRNHFFIVTLLILILFSQKGESNTLYVSSSLGYDSNDGLSERTPLKTLTEAFRKGPSDTILLKAGDIFYREETFILGTKLGKYGKGANPVLCGYKRIIKPNWERVSDNIWKLDLLQNNFSGVQVLESSLANNIGCIHEYDKDIIHGRKLPNIDQLERDWDMCQLEIKGPMKTNYYDVLYLYYSGNPNSLKLELSTGKISVTIRNGTIENVNVIGYGFGIFAGSNAIIKGCHIDAIGGRSNYTGNFVCDGNAINIWIYDDKDTENTLVEDCYISRVYDSGVCLSGLDGSNTTARNVIIKKNLITYCCQGWEDFLRNNPPSYYDNCVFENNVVVFSGESGFGYPQSRFKYCHVLSNNYKGDKKMVFRNNTFIGGNYHCNGGFNDTYTTNIWENNLCYITEDNYLLGNYMGTKNVIRVGKDNRLSNIDSYRQLTGDKTTRFKIKKNCSVRRIGRKAIKSFLRKHSY